MYKSIYSIYLQTSHFIPMLWGILFSLTKGVFPMVYSMLGRIFGRSILQNTTVPKNKHSSTQHNTQYEQIVGLCSPFNFSMWRCGGADPNRPFTFLLNWCIRFLYLGHGGGNLCRLPGVYVWPGSGRWNARQVIYVMLLTQVDISLLVEIFYL